MGREREKYSSIGWDGREGEVSHGDRWKVGRKMAWSGWEGEVKGR